MDLQKSTIKRSSRHKRFLSAFALFIAVLAGIYIQGQAPAPDSPALNLQNSAVVESINETSSQYKTATEALEALAVKGRAPKTGYTRSQFGNGWQKSDGCDTRNRILARDLKEVLYEINSCIVLSGILDDPYTGKTIVFQRGQETSDAIQIDHVVALSDSWQKGAQLLSPALREKLANDGLNLLAVDGPANQNKGDGDAATWLPANKPARCGYVARQISVKLKYTLWVTSPEKAAMAQVLKDCPNQVLEKY